MQITTDVFDEMRVWYPEFNATDYPDDLMLRALCLADSETGSKRWGTYNGGCSFKGQGLFAYAAHWLTLRGMSEDAAAGGTGMAAPAAVSSKSVADESASYAVATASSLSEQAQYGALGLTVYGQEFLRLRARAGAGAVAV